MKVRSRGSSIVVSIGDTNDRDLDAFSCGTRPVAVEVAELLRTRQWASWPEPPTLYRFEDLAGALLAFALVEETQYPHPALSDVDESWYLAIDALGVADGFRKRADPLSDRGETFAFEVLRAIEELVFAIDRAVGLILLVRESNTDARALYERFGFLDDGDGPFPDTATQEPTICMRKTY